MWKQCPNEVKPQLSKKVLDPFWCGFFEIKIENQLGIVYAQIVQKLHPYISYSALQMNHLH